MNQKKKIAVDFLSIAASNNLQRFFSFFVFLLIMSQLDVHDYGVLTLLFTLPGPILLISGLSMGKLITSEIAKARGVNDKNRIARLYIEYYLTNFVLFGILTILSLIFSNYLGQNYSIYLLRYFDLVLIYAFIQLLLNANELLLESYQKFKKLAFVSVLEPVTRVALLLCLIFTTGFNIRGVFIVYTASKAISCLLYYYHTRHLLKDLFASFRLGSKKTLLNLIKKHGKWLMIRDFFSQISNDITPWIIKLFLSTEMVAIFNVARKIVSIIITSVPFDRILFPLIASKIHDLNYANIVIQKFRKYATVISLLIYIGVLLITDHLIMIFFPQYEQSIILIQILSSQLILNSLSLGQKGIIYAANMQKFQFQLFTYSVFQENILKFVFIYLFNLIGLAISGLIHLSFLLIIKELYLIKNIPEFRPKLRNYFEFDEFDKKIIRAIFAKLKRAKKADIAQ